ncbi:hypothetical protein LTS18_000745, partial [Coniosporium uncinatum]
MGNQPSKDKDAKRGGRETPTGEGPSLDSYPSFSKSDTKESSRSLRTAIRSKIPGQKSTDSPRGSTTELNPGDRSDAASVKSSTSGRSNGRRHRDSNNSLSSRPARLDTTAAQESALSDDNSPPPSPTQSHTVGQGHDDLTSATRSGEVDHVSDAPPQGVPPSAHNAQAKESILVLKKDHVIPRNPEAATAPTDGTGSPIEVGALKASDLDDFITRLLDAGYNGKVTKFVCLKNAEIFAICQAAREVFLSQPSLLDLSPPVKIVGDIHGQYTDLIRMFEMCGFPPNANFLFLGDYVDRGKQSLETILLLLCYKLKFPKNFFLLRGNHECANVTRVYGFYDE